MGTAARLPDFYLIGAMKAATTTLAAQLAAQEAIFMSPVKEPNFFSDEENFARGTDWYARLFRGARPGQLLGEASTHYAKWPDYPYTAERLKAATPHAKFIYMIRHPVARARSHAFHEVRKRRGEEINAVARSNPRIWQFGCYATQLERWLEHFPPERFLIVCSERLAKEPETEFARVLTHLGAQGQWQDRLGEIHTTVEGYKALPAEKLLLEWGPLKTLRRHLIPKSWRTAVRKARAIDTEQAFTSETIAMIEEKTGPDLVRLGEMCGVELSLDTYKDTALTRHLELKA